MGNLAAGFFLLNKHNEILLVHPSGNYNRHSPWYFPKETFESTDDSIQDTAYRAVLEEVGLLIENVKHIQYLNKIKYKKSNKINHAYLGYYIGDSTDVQLDWENDQYKWVDIDTAKTMIKSDFIPFLDIIEKIIEI